MVHQSLTLCISLLLCSAAFSQSPHWIGTYDWAVVAPLGENITFDCILKDNGTDVLPANTSVVADSEHWQLAGTNNLLLGTDQTIGNKVVNKDKLTVVDVSLGDKGVYLCHVQLECTDWMLDNNKTCITERWYKHGLNLNGPLYANLMDKYRMKFIIGAIAGGSVLVVFTLLCLVYKFRHKEPKYEDTGIELHESKSEASDGGIVLRGYSGPGVEESPPAFGEAS